jgi:hypothetical protein
MTIRKYVFIVDGEVGPDLHFEDDYEKNIPLAAALSSNPVIVEVPIDSPVQMGWTWDGTNFIEPSN